MRIIDRYIFKQVVRGYILLLLSFTIFFIIIDLSTQLQDLFKERPPLFTIIKYYLFFSPQIFVLVSPFSFLLSALYNIGLLSKDNELISLRTQGLSIFSIARVFLVLAFFLSIVSLFVEDKLIPYSFSQLKDIRGYKQKNVKKNESIDKFAFYSPGGYLIFANHGLYL